MKKLHLLLAGLLTVLTVSAISTPNLNSNELVSQVVNEIPFFKTGREVVCANTSDMKAELKSFDSVWAGVNRDENTNKITSIVEVLMQDDRWIIAEHFTEGISCILGIGEEWAFNPKSRKKLGTAI